MIFPAKTLWSLSAVLKFFDEKSRTAINGLWYGFHLAVEQLRGKARRIVGVQTGVNVAIGDVVEIGIGPLYSVPLYLNPLDNTSTFRVVSVRPYDDVCHLEIDEVVWRQLYGYLISSPGVVESDYYLQPNSSTNAEFSLPTVLSDTPNNVGSAFYFVFGSSYWCVRGLWKFGDPATSAQAQYYISLIPNDFDVLPITQGSLTTALSYQVNESTLAIEDLYSRPTDEGANETANLHYVNGVDFRYWEETKVVEFFSDKAQDLGLVEYLYCRSAEVINNELYQWRGTMVDIGSYGVARVDNTTASDMIRAAELSLTMTGDLKKYETTLASAYRLPVAGAKYTVIGQFESVGYSLTGSSGSWELVSDSTVPYSGPALVGNTVYDVLSGIITTTNDLLGLTCHPLVRGRYDIQSWYHVTGAGYQVIIVDDPDLTLVSKIEKNIQVCRDMYNRSVLPAADIDIDGIRSVIHFISSEGDSEVGSKVADASVLMTYCYDYTAEDVPLYHDIEFPDFDTLPVASGNQIIGTMVYRNPDHKMLILEDESETRIKYYIDSPLYSRLNPGDVVEPGDLLVESLIVDSVGMFPGVKHLDFCRYSDKACHANSILELVQVNQIAGYGNDFPDQVVEIG